MEFLLRNLEAAQDQARSLTSTAGSSAKEFAEQFSEQTRSLAEQAASASSIAVEQAAQKWKGLNIHDTLQLKVLQGSLSGGSGEYCQRQEGNFAAVSINTPAAAAAGISTEELQQHAITPDFKDFVRSLNYSTFRDFPVDQLPSEPVGQNGKVLTPWQEKHALLIVKEVKEINELRFVLCPKLLSDSQFWLIYFHLANKVFPVEAFEQQALEPRADNSLAGPSLHDFQTSWLRSLESAKEAAREWSSRASGRLRPAETSAQLHDLVESRSRGATPTATSGAGPGQTPFTVRTEQTPEELATPGDLDTELEAYLQDLKAEGNHQGSDFEDLQGDAVSSEAEDLDEYLNELKLEEAETKREAAEAGESDLEEYMQHLGS